MSITNDPLEGSLHAPVDPDCSVHWICVCVVTSADDTAPVLVPPFASTFPSIGLLIWLLPWNALDRQFALSKNVTQATLVVFAELRKPKY